MNKMRRTNKYKIMELIDKAALMAEIERRVELIIRKRKEV